MSSAKAYGALVAMLAVVAIGLWGCPVPTPVTGNAANGQTDDNTLCAGCHRLGTFDTTGTAPDLSGKASLIVTNLGSISSAMSSITLTAQQVADLKAFVAEN